MTRYEKKGKKRVLITGADGRIAQHIICQLNSLSDVKLFLLSRTRGRLREFKNTLHHFIELADHAALQNLLSEIKPDNIIHTAAMTRPDECEMFPDKCENINVNVVEILAKHCQKNGAHITFLSSDFIFDGKQGPYDETAEPHPLNRYGQSKLRGEEILQSADMPFAILRGSFMYGNCPFYERPDLFDRVRAVLANKDSFRAPDDQFRSPTLAEDFARAACLASLHRLQGLFHVASDSFLSVYDMVRMFVASEGLETSCIIPVATEMLQEAAIRPLRVGLVPTKSLGGIEFEPRSFEEGLMRLRQARKDRGGSTNNQGK